MNESLEVIKGNWIFLVQYINSGLVYDVLVILGVTVESARGQHSKHLDPVAFLRCTKMSIIPADLFSNKNS